MKNLIRNAGIVLLTVLYCATICIVSDISQNAVSSVKSAAESAKNDLSVSVKLFSNTAQAENSVNAFSNLLPPVFNEANNGFSAIVKIRELFFASEFSQYIFTARNFLIKYGKANIIFPFHYFW